LQDKIQFSEPIGSAAPKFSQETKSLSFVRPVGVTLSLLCAAQGSPLPAYRLVKNLFSAIFFLNNELIQSLDLRQASLRLR